MSVRSSVLFVSKKQVEKCKKLKMSIVDLFENPVNLKQLYLRKNSKITIDLTIQKNIIKENFSHFYELTKLTDKSFLGSVKAQETKQIKGIEHLEKRLLKAQKRSYCRAFTHHRSSLQHCRYIIERWLKPRFCNRCPSKLLRHFRHS